jgi:hypothetical protein
MNFVEYISIQFFNPSIDYWGFGFDGLIYFHFQIGFLGLCGERVDSIEYYKQQIKHLDKIVSHNLLLIFYLFKLLWYFALQLFKDPP